MLKYNNAEQQNSGVASPKIWERPKYFGGGQNA